MKKFEKLIETLEKLTTEQPNPRSENIDLLSPKEICEIINSEDAKVAAVVNSQLDKIAIVAEEVARTIKSGHRLFYIGAGTSGRLGVLDAAECPPTFGSEPEQIIGVISGGYETLVLSKEGVEDDTDASVLDLKSHQLNKKDMIIGIAASRRTPYTLSGLKYAKSIGCKNAFIVCNIFDNSEIDFVIDTIIELEVGPEVITGSTRMKSGTAQKMTLNMITTTAMVLLGKTMGNLMVDLESRSDKLAARSRKILIEKLSLSYDEADELLERSNGSVKHAIVMHQHSCSLEDAKELLVKADGFINKIK